jgi:hypothetical protein
MNPTIYDRGRRIRVDTRSLADSTRDSVSFSDPSGLPRTTTAVVPPPLRAFLRNPRPSDASQSSAWRPVVAPGRDCDLGILGEGQPHPGLHREAGHRPENDGGEAAGPREDAI